MATTTPNYGWPVPTSTDLVKDGATAIEALGDAIDATLFASGAGLVKINTTTFSAVSSQSINNVFSATYNNYLILLDGVTSTTPDILFRLRVAGTDASGSTDYFRPGLVNNQNTTTILNAAGAATSSGYLGFGATSQFSVTSTFFNPFLAQPTLNSYQNYGQDFQTWGGNRHILSTSYTGITFFPTSGTMTGSVTIFGFAK
jgi:hypothetical protein